MKVLTVDDVTSNPLEGKKVAVIGYGAQGRAQALCFNDSGLDVVVGARPDGPSWKQATEDGLKVASIADAAAQADVVHMLIPDENQREVYASKSLST